MVGLLYGIMQKKRQNKTAAEILRKLSQELKPLTAGLLSEQAFDIQFAEGILKKVSAKVLTLKKSTTTRLAERIHSSWGAWYQGGDDETKIYGVFRELKDKVQVSQVAKAYQSLYGENLIDKLHKRFGKAEVKKVLEVVKKLPAYRTVKNPNP